MEVVVAEAAGGGEAELGASLSPREPCFALAAMQRAWEALPGPEAQRGDDLPKVTLHGRDTEGFGSERCLALAPWEFGPSGSSLKMEEMWVLGGEETSTLETVDQGMLRGWSWEAGLSPGLRALASLDSGRDGGAGFSTRGTGAISAQQPPALIPCREGEN